MAEIKEFPDCCGLIVVNKFKGGHPSSNPDDCMSPKDVNTFLEKNEQQFFNARAGLLATLSEAQNEKIGSVFLSRKWIILLDGVVNPRTGTKIWMYFRNLNHTKAREKRIFGER